MTDFTSLSILEALQSMTDATGVKTQKEFIPVIEANKRVLACDVVVRKNLPSFDNSAMDGFGFFHTDVGKKLHVKAQVLAGSDVSGIVIGEGECCRIMTGAQVPAGVDTIVPIERCSEITQESVCVPDTLKQGDNVRKKGEELQKGEVLFHKGEMITPAHIALFASQGINVVEVVQKLKIAIVSTGNEIKEPWEDAGEDEIYNANAYGIVALLKEFGFESSYVGAIPDSMEKSVEFIAGLNSYDVILSTGGISMGDADFLYQAYTANGLKSVFHGVNVKPGRPTMMGYMGDTVVMAMPGNPLTTMLNVFTLSLPVLFQKQGFKHYHHRALHVKCATDLKLRSGRDYIVLGYIKEGLFYATKNNKIGSGMLSPLTQSDVVAYFGASSDGYQKGEAIKVVSLLDITRTDSIDLINF